MCAALVVDSNAVRQGIMGLTIHWHQQKCDMGVAHEVSTCSWGIHGEACVGTCNMRAWLVCNKCTQWVNKDYGRRLHKHSPINKRMLCLVDLETTR